MPGIQWNVDCDGKMLKCLTWNENAEKVVNVMCLVKCEAKKVSAAKSADQKLQEIRVSNQSLRLVHVYISPLGKALLSLFLYEPAR